MLTANGQDRKESPVVFKFDLRCIECRFCGERVPLSRSTMQDPLKVAVSLDMAQDLHQDCEDTKSQHEAELNRKFREGMIRVRNGERVAWSA